ncbi:acetate--CoA ligase [Candidatus Woesearchaeota archaeon]|nr:acetate--CoA ligase [Candidatus Woesearchaeota archaeon]
MDAEDPLFILYTSGCCHGSSLIQLANGEIVKIKDIVDKNIKTKVVNMHQNPFVQIQDNITHLHKYPNTALLCKVRTSSFEAVFTPNHRLFSLDEYGNLVEKEASNLSRGDKVFVVSKINVEGEKQILPQFKQKKEYRNKTTYRPKNIPRNHNFLTPGLAQILGYLTGDGHTDKRSTIFTDKDKNNLIFYQKLIKKELNLISTIRKINRQRLFVNSSLFTNYIKKIFPEIICRSRNRSVPKIIQKSENECIAGFLRGLFDAEGTVGHSFIKLSNTSEELIRLTQLLLRRFGVLSNVYPGKNKERKIKDRKIKETKFLDVIISQRESLNTFYKKISFSHEVKKVKLEELMKKLSSKKTFPKERFPIFSLLKEITKTIKIDWKGEFNEITKFVYSNQTDRNGLRIIRDFLNSKIKQPKKIDRKKLEKLKLIRDKIQKLMKFKGALLEKVLEVKKIDDESDFVYDLTAQKNHNYIVNGFITHNTTGKPKGVLHTTGGYLTYVYQTFKWIFDYHEEDIYWCTADIGWITGHSYIIYGPLSNGATSLMFEGVPTYPEPDRFWTVVEKFKVNIFYTAPTAIRAVARFGDKWPNKHDLSSLRLLGTVGEPINPEAWNWYYKIIGKEKCPIVDTWWQTETGGILITPLPGAFKLKPGSANRPFPGIEPAILKEDGSEAKVNEGGYLIIKKPWPGLMRTVYGDHQRFIDTYWKKFSEVYLTGDGAKKDENEDYWLMGRIDDIINISGHRLGTAEVESALVSHSKVAEAAVVPMPHEIKGQVLYAFVTLNKGVEKSEDLVEELRQHVAKEIGPIAKPDKIQFADALPKTRSGKIMRRILKAIAEGKEDVGNITTLADPTVVDVLKKERL